MYVSAYLKDSGLHIYIFRIRFVSALFYATCSVVVQTLQEVFTPYLSACVGVWFLTTVRACSVYFHRREREY